MKHLIEALTIFLKYSDNYNPTNCVHDEFQVLGPPPDEMSKEDSKRLEELDFLWNGEYWCSLRFGSC